jgi:hypothetical protein
MERQTRRLVVTRRIANLLGGTAALLVTCTGIASAQSGASEQGLGGAWNVLVTVRDCASQAPLGPPFPSLVSFHRGGTLTESPGNQTFAPGQRTDGHGEWEHQGGGTYLQRVIALLRFSSAANLPGTPGFNPALPVTPGFQAGWQTITHTVEQTSADEFTSAGTNAFFDASGQQYRTGCSTAVGRRF